jgi:hypothetical protein
MANAAVLDVIADPDFQTELGQYNIELNVSPRPLSGDNPIELEELLRKSLNHAEAQANSVGAHIVAIGILPTLTAENFQNDWMSANPRYAMLNEAVFAARGEDLFIDIANPDPDGERLAMYADTIAPESACTSVQLHLQVSPQGFASAWNAAQALVGPQLALGANSPYFFGKQLWAETRTELFLQATDTRSVELKNQGVRPRVFFGERWITSIFDLFEENVRYFPALLPIMDAEDPVEVLHSGGVPRLSELRLHNGTVYRWNRPVYDIMDGRPHLRVENRVLPAGPTLLDLLANAAFYFGLVRDLAESGRPIWSQLTFSQAEENFHVAARDGLDATLYWPRRGALPATRLVLDWLLPMAYDGLDRFGVSPDIRDRLLGIIEGRCRTGMNGATWQTSTVERLEREGLDRPAALREMLHRYAELFTSDTPVHTWPLD